MLISMGNENPQLVAQNGQPTGDGAWAGADRGPAPLVGDQAKRGNETDARWHAAGLVGDTPHFEAHQVVGRAAPKLLADGLGATAQDRLETPSPCRSRARPKPSSISQRSG